MEFAGILNSNKAKISVKKFIAFYYKGCVPTHLSVMDKCPHQLNWEMLTLV